MKYKKSLIFVCIVICLFTIGSVVASDVNETVVASDNQNEILDVENNDINDTECIDDNPVIKSVNENDYLAASSDGTFTDLANEIANANGELRLTKNYVYDSSKDSNYKNGIEINKELTINGKGFIINGENNARAFNISNGNVVLRNIEFINCSSSGSGGAVYWNGANGCLFDCEFLKCYSSGSGGAVYWNGKNGSLHDCNFMNCYKSSSISGSSSGSNSNSGTTSRSGSSSGYGGAVYWAGDEGSLFNCRFEDCNNSQYNSYSHSYYSGSLTTGSSSESTSNSYSYGGAVYWKGKYGSLFDCDFINCYSYSYSYSKDHMYNSYRDLCDSSISSSSYSYDSIYWVGQNGNLFDCSFINSTSSSASSCKSTHNRQGYAGSGTNLIYFDSYSYSNSYSYGGAVYWVGNDGNLFDCNFITPNSKPSSSTSGSGGAVYWYGTDGDLSNCSFMNCRIPNGGYANAVYWQGANGGLLNCSFVDCNSSSNSGYNGSVYWSGTNGVLFNCSFNEDYYNYENYCSKSSSSTVYPVMLIHTSNDGHIVIFECTQLVNNISVTLYNVTGRKVLYDEFDISSDDLTSSYTVNYLEGGEYQIVLHYGGDNFYTSTSTNNLFENLYKSRIELDLKNNYIFDEKIPLTYTIAPDCTGIISIYIDNAFKANISVGDAFEFETLDAGEYNITVIYNGDENFLKSNDSCILKVSKADPSIDVSSSNLLGNVSFVISLNETATGNVTLILNDINSYLGNLTNGKTNIIVPNLNAGDCSAKIIYNGCKNYNNKTYVTTLTIDKIPTTVTGNVDDITYAENAIINVKGGVDGIAIVKIDETYIKSINVIANTITSVTFENIPVGKHDVTVTLKPTNTNYNESKYNTDFTVYKKETSVNLNVVNSVYGEDVIVNVTTSEDGKVILKVGSITHEENVLANTLTKINLGVLAASSYNVEVSFDAGENYKPNTKNGNIVISPAKAEILILQAENNVYGDNTIIKVKTNVEGALTFNIGSITKTFDIVANNLTLFNFGILDAKIYAVEVSLDAGNNYTKPINTTQVIIESKESTVDVNVKNSTYGEHVIVNVTSSENGEISVNIGDITKYVNVEANKSYSVDFSVLNADSYNVYVSFDGGSNYKKSYNNAFLIVSPAKSQITEIQAPNNSYGENTIIRIKANEDGVLTAKINTITKEVNLNANQLTSIDFGILDANNYEVELSFNAGNNYVPTTDTKTFKVLKIDPTISVEVINSTYGQSSTIIVNSNAEGNATIEIGSVKTYNNVLFNNNMIIQDVTDIDVGLYSIKVTFNGNNNYNVKTYDAKLTVNKASTTTVSTVDDITYTENAIIYVKCSVDGIAIVKIDESHIKNINVIANTIAPATFENLPVGKHNVTITLKPSSKNYEESTFNTDFSVSQKETSVNLNVVDSVYGEDVIVNVTASEDGKVILNVDGIIREKNVLANIQTTINLGVLSAKSYDVKVSFNAGENYKLSTQQKSFTVNPVKAEITAIQVQNNTYGENTIINVKTDVAGILTVKLNNANAQTFNIDANKLTSFDLGKHDANNYDVSLILNAGSNYTKATGNAKVTVNPKQTTVEINVKDNVYGKNVIVNVTASENGKVTVNVGTNVRTVDVEANKLASIDFGILDAKSYEVSATFDGGKNYQTSSDKTSLVVSPKTSTVTLVDFVNSFVYTQNIIIKMKSDTTGTLTVKVGDTPQTKQVTAGNIVTFDFGLLDVKTYEVTIRLDVGNNYIQYQNSTSITVTPKSTTVTFINPVNSYTYSENVIIKLKTDTDGALTVKIGNISKTKQVTAGDVVVFDFGILDVATYDVTLSLDTGNNYIPYHNTTSITIAPKSTSIVLNTKDYYASEHVIVNVTASENGKVTIKLGDFNKTIDVDANVATSIDFGLLDVGTYNVVANFIAGNNYINSTDVGSVKVLSKIKDEDVNISIPQIVANQENQIVINLPSDATGTVIISINNENYTTTVKNGNANIDLPVLINGDYPYTITYSGDDKYASFTRTGTINVDDPIPTIVADDMVIDYGSDYDFNATFFNSDGSPLANVPVTFKVNDEEYFVKTDSNGIAVLKIGLKAGNYTITSINSKTDETKVNLLIVNAVGPKPIDEAQIDVPSLDGATGGSISVKLPDDATGTITLDINGKSYDFDLVNGTANVDVPDLSNGDYTYVISYSGDDKYASFNRTGTINVDDPIPTIVADDMVIDYGSDYDFNATFFNSDGSPLANVPVTFKVNDEEYFVKTDSNGIAVLKIGLKAGNYTITSINSATQETKVNTLIVNAVGPKPIDEAQIDVPSLDGATGGSISVKLPDDATGTITLDINGKSYDFDLVNGTANVDVPDLSNGDYTYAISYSGDDKYASFTRIGSLNVNKIIPTQLTAAQITTVYNGGKYLIITLKDISGNVIKGDVVSINLNGKLLSQATDSNGQVKFSTNGLAPKIYTASVTFAGNGNYAKSSTTAKVTVTKATPKITAKAKTFKKSVKTKKYTITLKDNNGKVMKKAKVTIKIKGKTYKATTNSKGKATFKITKLTKKGTFKSVISYKGNSYYKKVTKKVKIKVK